ncbi:MAG: hypothetical protein ACYDHX_08065 [Methanothrix sp.]
MSCHGGGDIVMGTNRDWARVTGHRAILQKIALLFAIPRGELINSPDIGCTLQSHLGDKLTDMSLIELSMELEQDLKNQIPELFVHTVTAERGSNKNEVRLTIDSPLGLMVFGIDRDELLNMNLIDSFTQISEGLN